MNAREWNWQAPASKRNRVHQSGAHPLWQGIPQDERFYFVHSYYVQPTDPTLVTGRCEYGVPFASYNFV